MLFGSAGIGGGVRAELDGSVSPLSGKFEIKNDGFIVDDASYNEQWLLSGQASECEVYCEKVSGNDPTGSALDTWLSLGTTRAWNINEELQSFLLQITIRRASNSALLAQADYQVG